MTYSSLIFDGRNTLFRAAYVARPLITTVPGLGDIPIGGVFQFLKIVLHTVERRAAPGCAVVIAWEGDDDGRSWRRDLFPGYKANRDPDRHKGTEDGHAETDLHRQEGILRGVLTELGWSQAWSPGAEADDTLATLAARLEVRGPVAIVTGDRDLHQCITSRVHVVDRDVWTLAEARKKWGVEPTRIPEVKALSGDKSDGIPGIRGIGEKGAAEILARWPTLEDAIEGARAIWPGDRSALLQKLVAGGQDALLFRRIATVQRDAPLEFAARARVPAREVFERFRFTSLLAPSTLRAAEALAGIGS